MIYLGQIETKLLELQIQITSRNLMTHARTTDLHEEFAQVLNKGTEYLKGLIESFEEEHEAELKEVGG